MPKKRQKQRVKGNRRRRHYFDVHGNPVEFAHYEKPALSPDVLKAYRHVNTFPYEGFLAVEGRTGELAAKRHPTVHGVGAAVQAGLNDQNRIKYLL